MAALAVCTDACLPGVCGGVRDESFGPTRGHCFLTRRAAPRVIVRVSIGRAFAFYLEPVAEEYEVGGGLRPVRDPFHPPKQAEVAGVNDGESAHHDATSLLLVQVTAEVDQIHPGGGAGDQLFRCRASIFSIHSSASS